jgi:hypothetical protein
MCKGGSQVRPHNPLLLRIGYWTPMIFTHLCICSGDTSHRRGIVHWSPPPHPAAVLGSTPSSAMSRCSASTFSILPFPHLGSVKTVWCATIVCSLPSSYLLTLLESSVVCNNFARSFCFLTLWNDGTWCAYRLSTLSAPATPRYAQRDVSC